MPKKMMFARLDFSTFLICCSGDFSDNKSDEKLSVAICGGSICILTGLFGCSAWITLRPSRTSYAARDWECEMDI